MFFGVGYGYSGTHLLAKLLDLPGVDCKHERISEISKFAFFDKYRQVYAGILNQNDVFVSERKSMIDDIQKTHNFGEINGLLTFFITAIHKNYPDAKFIFTTRDPRQHVLTLFNTGTYDEKLFKEIRKVPFWILPKNVIKKDKNAVNAWNKMSRLAKCSWSWKLLYDEALLQLNPIPKKLVFVCKFEDMIQGKLDELYAFLNLNKPANIDDILKVKHNKTPVLIPKELGPWNKLSKAQKDIILNITNGTRQKIGY